MKGRAAIFGLWWSSNYGSQMTYYALNRLVESMGYQVFMIDRPGFAPDNPLFFTHGRRFSQKHYEISPSCDFRDLKKLNEKADVFLMGSDQVWNFSICRHYRGAFYLNFVRDDKKKIAYGASFGHPGFFAPEEEIEKARKYLSRFDAISVREEDAVWIINHTFGLKAKRVLDPVFAADSEIFREIWESSEREMPGKPYLAAYILDPTPEKREALRYLSAKLELRWLLCWMESGILKRIKSRSICRAWQRILWWRTGWLTFADAVILLQIPVMERALRFCSKSPLSALETREGEIPGWIPWPMFFA